MLVDHVFKGERLQAFSDAVFAIIATIMVSLCVHTIIFICVSVCGGSGGDQVT